MKRVMTGLSILVLAAGLAVAGEAPLEVFILAGQSNMDGRANPAELPAALQEQANVLSFVGGTNGWVPLKPGKMFGPEIGFGQAMASALGRPIGLVKFSKGGTNLAKQWDPASTNSLYATLAKKVEQAGKSRPIRIVAMLWMQGESDAREPAMAAAYQSNLVAFVARARADFGVPDLPFICGRVNPLESRFPQVGLVRAAQEKPGIAHYAWVDCDGLKKAPDNLHYNAEGQLELGKKFAEAVLKSAKP